MKKIQIPGYAKINLTLDVTGKLPNGYHTVKMIMQTVGLHDDVIVALAESGEIHMTTNLAFLPTGKTNLAVRAANAFYEATEIPYTGLNIHVEKRIPVAAGLAGGSTDAAAVLVALNVLHEAGLSQEKLCEIGLKLGADVPYCVRGGTMLAEGIGEVLTPLPAMPACFVVLCKPAVSVSTPAVYSAIDNIKICERPDTAGMIAALESGDIGGICHRLYNVMEPVTGSRHPEIAEIRRVLIDEGARGAVMSGSGPTVFGLFTSEKSARRACEKLKPRYRETYLTQIYP